MPTAPPAPRPHHPTLGVLALIAAAALWSLNGPLIKILSAGDAKGATIACLRSLMGGIVFLPFAWPRRYTLRRVHVGWPIASIVAFTVMTVTFVKATTMTSAANAIILQYTSAIWVFLFSPLLLRERVRALEGGVLVVAMGGIGVIFAGHAGGELPALSLALLSGLGYGMLTIFLRGLREVSPVVVASLNALGSGILLIIPAAIETSFRLSPATWGAMVIMALVQFTGPYFLFSWALQHVTAYRAGMIVLLEVILNPLWTFLAVGERPHTSTLIGGAMILAAIVGAIFVARPSSATDNGSSPARGDTSRSPGPG